MKYHIIVEETDTGFAAYAPDLPGCVATANTREKVEAKMNGAIAFHLDGLKAEGLRAPKVRRSSR